MPRAIVVEGGVKRGNTYYLLPEEIEANPTDNRRAFPHTPAEIKDLAEEIRVRGQLQPVGIRLVAGVPRLVFGFGRLGAFKLLNEDRKGSGDELLRIRCEVVDANDDEAAVLNIVENAKGKNTTPVDDAENVRFLGERLGKNDGEIATIYGKSPAWVSLTRKLLQLPTDIRKKVHKKEIQASVAYKLADLEPEARDQMVAEMEAAVVGDGSGADGGGGSRGRGKRMSRAEFDSAAREKGVSDGPVTRTAKEIREYFEGVVETAGPGTTEGELEHAKAMVQFCKGEISERQMGNRLEKVLKVRVG